MDTQDTDVLYSYMSEANASKLNSKEAYPAYPSQMFRGKSWYIRPEEGENENRAERKITLNLADLWKITESWMMKHSFSLSHLKMRNKICLGEISFSVEGVRTESEKTKASQASNTGLQKTKQRVRGTERFSSKFRYIIYALLLVFCNLYAFKHM